LKKYLFVWVSLVLALFLNLNPWHSYGAGPHFIKPQDKAIPYSMEYETVLSAKDALTINFFNIEGFDKVVIENVSSDSKTATVYSSMGLTPGVTADTSKPPQISIVLPIIYQQNDPNVYIRVRKSIDTPVVFCLKFLPSETRRTGKVASGSGEQKLLNAPGCPTWCWWATIVSYVPPCIQVKCCQQGGVTYDLNNCTITCWQGDCSDQTNI
jgi:hypothetical protein